MHLVTAIQVIDSPDKTYRMFPLALWTYGIPLRSNRVSIRAKPPQHRRASFGRNLQFPAHRTALLPARNA